MTPWGYNLPPWGFLTSKERIEKMKLATLPVYVLLDDDCRLKQGVEAKFITIDELDKVEACYVVTSDGVFLKKKSELISSVAPIKDVPFLASGKEIRKSVKMQLPPIPGSVIFRAWRFFARVYQKYRSESAVLLLYNKQTKQYELWCPKQDVSGGSVNYVMKDMREEVAENWQVVGTIHSHCDFDAFHSGVDVDDEKDMDGLHITIGHVNGDNFSFISSIVANGCRFEVEGKKICPELIPADSQRNTRYTSRSWTTFDKSDEVTTHFFILNDVENEQEIEMWLEKVEKKTYSNFGLGFGGFGGGKKRKKRKGWQ